MSPTRWWYILSEGLRFAWACRQKARGFPWTILPIPPKAWVKWRLDTMYGEHFPRPPFRRLLKDFCSFLLWRRSMRLRDEARRDELFARVRDAAENLGKFYALMRGL